MPRLRSSLLALVTGFLLAAEPAAAAECPGADVEPTAGNVAEIRAAVVCLTNQERAAVGLGGLVLEGGLEAIAQSHSERMVAERFFDHVGPGGFELVARLVGHVGWLFVGENLAWGEGPLATPRSTVAAWMGSPGHRANLLASAFAEVGVGVTPGTPRGSTRPAATYVAEYGIRSLAPAPAAAAPPSTPARAVAAPPAAPPSTPARAVAAPPAAAAPPRRAKPRPAPRRCRRGTVRRVQRVKGRRVVRCVRVARRR